MLMFFPKGGRDKVQTRLVYYYINITAVAATARNEHWITLHQRFLINFPLLDEVDSTSAEANYTSITDSFSRFYPNIRLIVSLPLFLILPIFLLAIVISLSLFYIYNAGKNNTV